MDELFRFGFNLSKSYTTTERGAKLYVLEGIASDQSSDQQGEQVIQAGMNFEPLLRSGIVNWDHLPGPENIIGEPLEAEIQPGPAFYVRSSLYVEDKERARETWTTAEAMKKSGRRSLGWSVEGAILQRAAQRILKSEVRHLAVTHQPVNANTWAAIVKSMTASDPGAQALQLENLGTQITSVLWGNCAAGCNCYHPETGHYRAGRAGMLEHLVKCKGMSVEQGADLMKRLINATM